MNKIKYFILEQIFPGYYASRSNKKVKKKYNEQENYDVNLDDITGDKQEYIDLVKADLKEQHDRKKIIEEKAKSLLFIIAVSVTAITFSLLYLKSIEYNLYQLIALVFLGISILYFVQGVIKALQTLNIRKFHIIQTDVEISNNSYKLTKKKSDEDFLKELIKSKQQNDLINILLSNYAFASFNLIRNGIIFFTLFFAATIYGNYFTKKDNSIDKYTIKKEIKTTINDTTTLTIPYTFELKYDINNLKINKNKN